MSVGTSDTAVFSATKPEDHNFNTINASVVQRDGSSPANKQANTAENPELHKKDMING